MPESTPQTSTLDGWKQAAVHKVTLPSSAVVEIKLPNLGAILKTGTLPNELNALLKAAVVGTDEVTDEMVEKIPEFQRELALLTAVNPKLDETTVDEIPYEDLVMLSEFALRQRDTDALDNHIAGLDKVQDFARFRELGLAAEDLAVFGEGG